MAAAKSQESPPSLFSRRKYQAFLSFRGEDTRNNFISHLYAALVQAGIHTFRDDHEIRRGENIELEIIKAIQQSKIAIVVFSEEYSSSRWCLDELVMIMEQRRTAGCKVLPVFYHVDPSDVWKQTGSFGRAFIKHEKRPYEYEEIERVNGWRVALEEVANLAGMVLREGHEAEFVKSIVKEVTKQLNPTKFHVPYFIGRDSLLKVINSWLQSGSYCGEIAMLYGIGGVGKTTIAMVVCSQHSDKFESISFLRNIRPKSKQSNGLLSLQKQLLYDVLSKNASEIQDEDEGFMEIKDAICCKKILVVLDDVDDKDQFNAIIGMREWLYPGSKIIITTRVRGLFAIHEDCLKFKVEPLDEKESIELFSWHAFGQAHLIKEFVELSRSMVRHCNGLPVALAAIGSSLSSTRRKEVWKSALLEMEKIPHCKVQKVLRISYDSLDDDCQKDLLLDIACFFDGMNEVYLVQILKGLGIGAEWRIDNLINRCLVEIDNRNRLWMHQIIRDMGREIAREQSPKCKRTWDNEEALNMLTEITDTEMVRGLTLDMHASMEHSQRKDHDFLKGHQLSGFFLRSKYKIGQTSLFPILNTAAFKKMKKIKFLQLNYVKFNGSYEQFPKSLIWLRWHGFFLRSIPKQFSLEKLVVLDMQSSSMVYVWEGKMPFPELKILNLSHSHGLIITPDFSHAPKLEILILEDCINLVEIHRSIGELRGLLILNLKGCKRLEELPEEISQLDSLEELVLDGCSSLEGQQLHRRWSLHRDGIVSIMPHMTAMPLKLFFRFWFTQRKKNMRFSTLSVPRFLVKLDLSRTPIRCLPESINDLTTLEELNLRNCTMLQQIPKLPTSLLLIAVDECYSLEKVLPDIMSCNSSLFLFCGFSELQEWVKVDFIRRVDVRLFVLLDYVMGRIQNALPFSLQITVESDLLSAVFCDDSGILSSAFKDTAWMTIHDFPGITFKLSFANEGQLCFISYTRLSITLPLRDLWALIIEITNNTKGQSKQYSSMFPLNWQDSEHIWERNFDALRMNCWVADDDLVFEDGDEVSVWMYSTTLAAIQIQMVAIEPLYAYENDFAGLLLEAKSASSLFRFYICYGRVILPSVDPNSPSTLCYNFFREALISMRDGILLNLNFKQLFSLLNTLLSLLCCRTGMYNI